VKLVLRILLFIFLSVTLAEGVAFSQEAAPETKPSVTVTGKVPPPYHDPYTYVEPDSLLESSMSGSVYRNHFFAFSYTLPQGWTAEDIQITRKRDKGETVRAEPPGSSLTAQTVKILGPVIVLNATRVDAANRERLAVPFVSISVNPSGSEPLSVESIRHSLDSTESVRQAHGIRLRSEPVEISVSGHSFFPNRFQRNPRWGNNLEDIFQNKHPRRSPDSKFLCRLQGRTRSATHDSTIFCIRRILTASRCRNAR
jgi:hypothetical protein